ncbi:uncharacterized protein LOC106866055 [Brachypodium distachyon]|uniref:uncharacterized protein LOC106866055 n=1 Tax=Brachypodium distachyon TaxID=15368 RepID=UPI00071CF716|nr:uncharacterized protein LOC106866055 [Brachypodium distachyon]|eukprot:XP_014754066.1 uncharacterized protein LOC106866055 [Brachypodium distachyon]
MDIDSDSGSSNPGTERPNSAEAMAIEPMEVDESVFMTRPVPAWAQPKMSYLKDGSLPEDEVSARQIQRRAKAYTIINDELYKRSVTNVLQRCVEPEEGQEILRDIHQGDCGHHASSRTLVAKAFRHGFYWPSALQEAEDMVRKCNGCQRYGYPHSIITDNGTNFAEGAFARFCAEKKIQLDVASVAHPQSNGQVERANGYKPFFLIYGAKAVLPADIQHDSPRVTMYTEAGVKEVRENDVDLLEEAQELALSRSSIYQ